MATGSLEDVIWQENPGAVLDALLAARAEGEESGSVERIDGRVMLAASDPAVQMQIAGTLRMAGAHVVVVNSTPQLIEKTFGCTRARRRDDTRYQIDTIVVDMALLMSDGHAVIAEVRDAGYQGPIVAFADGMTDDVREKGLDIGCDVCVESSVNQGELVAAVADCTRDSVAVRS